ncbi:Methionine aminopeptidase 1 [Savitreella phatthalungensis]
MALTCASAGCVTEASSMACPICLKEGRTVRFCGTDCFKRNFPTHKKTHQHDPFAKTFSYPGPLRACYPLSAKREVPAGVSRPDYADHPEGRSLSEERARIKGVKILNAEEREGMRKVCRLAREVLDIAAAALRPGITTDEIDQIVHDECVKRDSYPSPLNYYRFPKSVCTSVNEIICHGIPDARKLAEGDIVNLDVTLYHNGFHGDLNETYYVGQKIDGDSVRVVETARECLDLALASVKPGVPFRSFGKVIEEHATKNSCSVVTTYCGHGINQLFHCSPNIPHYGKNKAPGMCTEGMCFTIEPMINLGSHRDISWPDNWTASTVDGKRSAQFEHTILVTKDGCEILTARKADSPGAPRKRQT